MISNGCGAWCVSEERGGRAIPTGQSITTTRHGSVGTRPELRFAATLQARRGAGELIGAGDWPPPLPTSLHIRAVRGDRSYDAVRLSQSAWDDQPEEEKLARLEDERRWGWPDATPADVRKASTFTIAATSDEEAADESTDGSDVFRRVEFYVYVCAPGLDGGVVSASVNGFAENGDEKEEGKIAKGAADKVSISWASQIGDWGPAHPSFQSLLIQERTVTGSSDSQYHEQHLRIRYSKKDGDGTLETRVGGPDGTLIDTFEPSATVAWGNYGEVTSSFKADGVQYLTLVAVNVGLFGEY